MNSSNIFSLVVGRDYWLNALKKLWDSLPGLDRDALSISTGLIEMVLSAPSRIQRNVGISTWPIFFLDRSLAANFLLVAADPALFRCIYLDKDLVEMLPKPEPPYYQVEFGNNIIKMVGESPNAKPVLTFIDRETGEAQAHIYLGDAGEAAQRLVEEDWHVNVGIAKDSRTMKSRRKALRKAIGYSYP